MPAHHRRWRLELVGALSCLLLLTACAAAEQGGKRREGAEGKSNSGGRREEKARKEDSRLLAVTPKGNRGGRERALLVSLANGKLVALDKYTGKKLWTFDSGSPLLTSTNLQPAILAQPEPTQFDSGHDDLQRPGSIFPGTDGSLYAYLAGDGSRPHIERLPVGVPDLVNQSPVATLDGSMLIGSQHTSVYLIDGATGRLLRTVYDFDGELGQLDAAALGEESGLDVDLSNVLVIGRKDYVLRSVHPQFGLQWNVTWGRVNRLSELEVHHADGYKPDSLGSLQAGPEAMLPHSGGAGMPPGDISLLVGPDFSLRCVHPGDGWEHWQQRFDAAPVAAYSASSGKTDLLAANQHQRSPASAAPGSAAASYAALLPTSKGGSANVPVRDAVVLVVQNGSLIGVPAAQLTFQAANGPGVVGAASQEQCQVPPVERLVRKQQQLQDSGSSQGSALAIMRSQGQDSNADGQPSQCKPADTDVCTAATVAVYAVHESTAGLLLLPAPPNVSTNSEKQRPAASSLQWLLVLLLGATFGAGSAMLLAWKWRTRKAADMQQPAARPMNPHPGTTTDPPNTSKGRRKGGSGSSRKQHMSNRLKGIMQQAATEGAMQQASSAGVVAEVQASPVPKHQQETGEDDSLPSTAAVTAGLADPAMNHRQVKDGVILVGRMRVGPGVLGYGSGGTVVFYGELDGRPVAVKRMLRQFYEMARKEINALILADEHPNIVRCFAMEEDHEFVYLALERCKTTLHEAMQSEAVRSRLVDQDGQPTPFAFRIAADIAQGVAALHERGIVHRDLKPHNVLLTEGGRAKLSDMGLSKRLVPEQVSFESVGSGGSSGWQAPEQLISRSGGTARQTNSVDVFSYGLLLHYCLTAGQHPFGELYERDANILQRRLNLKHIAHLPEAVNLIRGCCEPQDPSHRPPMSAVLAHPLWWPAPQRLGFLIAVSDRVEGEDRAEDRTMYQALECCVEDAIGRGGSWAALMDSGLVNNLGKYRKYSYSSLRDLLRVIRNKHNHFRELPVDLQKKVGPLPTGFLRYFTGRYPGLFMVCYYFALKWCSSEHVFQPYFSEDAHALLAHMAPMAVRHPKLPAAEAAAGALENAHVARGSTASEADSGADFASAHLSAADDALTAAREAAAAAAAASAALMGTGPPGTPGIEPLHHSSGLQGSPQQQQQPQQQPQQQQALHQTRSTPENVNAEGAPVTPGNSSAPVAAQQGEAFAGNMAWPAKGDRPSISFPMEPSLPEHDINPVCVIQEGSGTVAVFPRRAGQPVCDFYQKTGHCRFGAACRFDHPPQYAVRLNRRGLPLRPGQLVCSFYERTGECKFGPSCKFDHPDS